MPSGSRGFPLRDHAFSQGNEELVPERDFVVGRRKEM
jgi:hypothetical protein